MLSGVFKHVYRGHGVYWFGKHGYGDETNPGFRTVAEMHAAIDAKIAAKPPPTPIEAYWETVPHDQRRKWRQLAGESDLSAAELAYAAR